VKTKPARSLLEIGSGTGQHSIYFSQALPKLQWQTSDQFEYLGGIRAALNNAKANAGEFTNLLAPLELNVNQDVWVDNDACYDAVYTANTFHIMNQMDVEAFFSGLPAVTKAGSYLVVYGPFKYKGNFTSESNAHFDHTLRSRGVGSAIRDFERVNELATAQRFKLIDDHSMPANNQCLIWQRTA